MGRLCLVPCTKEVVLLGAVPHWAGVLLRGDGKRNQTRADAFPMKPFAGRFPF
jgi:hypothetical protein